MSGSTVDTSDTMDKGKGQPAGASGTTGGPIVKAVDNLEQMFEKADNEINYLTRKMSFELDYGKDGSAKPNPNRLLDRVQDIKKEFTTVSKDLEEIEKAKTETIGFLRGQLTTITDMLQRLETQTGSCAGLSEEDSQKFEQLAQMLGLSQSDLLPPHQGSEAQASPGVSSSSTSSEPEQNQTGSCVSSASNDSSSSQNTASVSSSAEQSTDEALPQISPYECRADSAEFLPLTQEEFMSVSELIRVRAKLDDVNRTYRLLWQHFKEEGSIKPLSPRDMNAKGMKVTGATGEAKLKVLRALKLCKIGKGGEVTLT